MLNDKIAYTDEMLATIFRREVNVVRLALNTFRDFGMVEILNNVITIPNWAKHQTLDQLEERKEYMREYMQKYRDKQKMLTSGECKVNSKVNSKANVNSLEGEEEIDIDKEIDIEIKEIDKSPPQSKKETKHKYGEYKHVSLTDIEYSKLIEEFGEPIIKQYIEKVDEYVEQFGKRYKNYNLTIRNWLKKDGGKRGSIGKNTGTSQGKVTGYKPIIRKPVELTESERKQAEELI